MNPKRSEKFSRSTTRVGPAIGCLAMILGLATPAGAQSSADTTENAQATPPGEAATARNDSMRTRHIWTYALLGTAVAGIATGVTLVTVNHARVNDYNIGVENYDRAPNPSASDLQQLADLRSSINTGERWGYIVGGVGLAAALGAAYLYVTDAEPSPTAGGVALGLRSLTIYGHF